MANYIGRNLANLSDRVVLDALTASATASYTLQLNSVNFVPSSASSLTVSLNGVIQKPDSSYTVSGSTLTFSSALTSSDSIDFIIAERGITLQTPSAGSVGTSQLASTAVTTAKIADDAVTKDKLLSHNYPAFEVYLASNQTSISDDVVTKVQFDGTALDTNSYWDSTNYRYKPLIAGKYYVYAQIFFGGGSGADVERIRCDIYKNGSNNLGSNRYLRSQFNGGGQSIEPDNMSLNITAIIDMNGTTDFLEVFGQIATHNNTNNGTFFGDNNGQTAFSAYRIGD